MKSVFKYTFFLWIVGAIVIPASAQSKIQLVLQSGHTGSIKCLATSSSGKYFATGGEDQTLKIWNAETGTVVRNLILSKAPVTRLAFSDDDFYLVSVQENKKVKIWRVEPNPDNKIIDKSTIYKQTMQKKYAVQYSDQLSYSPENDDMPGGFLKEYKGIKGAPSALAFGRKKQLIYGADESGNIYYWDATLSKPQYITTMGGGFSSNILALPGDKKMVTTDNDWLNVRKNTGKVLASVQLKGMVQNAVLYDKGKKAAMLLENGDIQLVDVSKPEIIGMVSGVNAKLIAAAEDTEDFYYYNGSEIFKYLGSQGQKSLLVRLDENITQLGLSSKGYVITVNEHNNIVVRSDKTGTVLYTIPHNMEYANIKMSPDWRFVANINAEKNYVQMTDLFHGNTFLAYPGKTIVPEDLMVSTRHTAVALEDGSVNIYDSENGYLWKTVSSQQAEKLLEEDDLGFSKVEATDELWQEGRLGFLENRTRFPMVFSPDGNWVFTVDNNYEVNFSNPKGDKKFRLLLSPLGTVLLAPDNRYFESGNGHELVKFMFEGEVYSFEQFDLHFNRPDKVLKALEFPPEEVVEVYNKAYNLRLKRLGYTNSRVGNSFHVPKVEITGVENMPFETKNRTITLPLKMWDTKYKIEGYQVKINGVMVKDEDLKSKNVLEYEEQIELYLTGGMNRIEIVSRNEKGTLSIAAVYSVKRIGEVPDPNLYIFTVGTSKFSNEKMNLNYASKDAKDIASTFAEKGTMFGKVNQYSLFDEQVTLENIRKTVGEIKKCNPDDYFYFFIASHGILDENFELYLGTHDVDFADPKKRGLSYSEIESMLMDIPARHKLLVMDACHSGELDKGSVQKVVKSNTEYGDVVFRSGSQEGVETTTDMNYLDIMKSMFTEMQKSSGATIISSAGGTEYAMEGKQWKNGVFTYSFLSGLKNGEADLNKDGTILLSELNSYLIRRVPELTNGNQKPTSRTVNTRDDIRVWY